ncbi:transketolase family protein [Caulobacter mirabilis]|uniref:Transketolase n=1 Tax=Caulobacter mirabilis TaxID=69666 RepID=A0A2D2AT10_9CAUL|nr:transketolase C-terminal domain-containing protein [Caulobacter mirabilis]ATQ41139.1 transketolase [Caulobacter mirabilis]
MRDSFIKALTELAEIDPRVVLITGDLGFGVLTDFANNRPDQFINAGVAEQNMTALAAGMALEGARAYTYSIANFTTLRCLEQLRNDVCYHEADVTAVSVGGGFSYGQLGMSHFATEDLAIMRALPNMTVVAPSDPWQALELTRQLHARGGPAYLRLDKDKAGLEPAPASVVLGKVREVRAGADAVIFATGAILGEALAAAETLAAEGAAVRVVDVHTLKPLDVEGVVAIASECGVVVTVEEHNKLGGLGGAIAEACLEGGAKVRSFRRVGLSDLYPTIVGDQKFLRRAYEMDAPAIAAVVRDALKAAG